jgi:acyl dehydratase
MALDVQRGLVGSTFDELSVGDEFWSPARTVTEGDITAFASLSGDWNPHHVDAEFAAASPLGVRLAHGGLVVTILSGLVVRLRIFEATIVALLEWTWKFQRPVLAGTRLQARVRIAEKKETSNPERGIIDYEVAGINEDDEVVVLGVWKVLMLRSASDAA